MDTDPYKKKRVLMEALASHQKFLQDLRRLSGMARSRREKVLMAREIKRALISVRATEALIGSTE